MVYQTQEKEKEDSVMVEAFRDSLGHHVTYTLGRVIEATLDTVDLRTLSLHKVVAGRVDVHIERRDGFRVRYRGRDIYYRDTVAVYDRHTLDFAFRAFEYGPGFQRRIRLHVPEFMIVNADLKVLGEETVATPLGEFACWKIQMTPRIVLLNWHFYFWFEKDYPHRFIKYADSSNRNSIFLRSYRQY